MFAITKKTEYGLIAACHLARSTDAVVSAREIAECYGLRLPLLMNVLKSMQQRGLLKSIRGAAGGYALAMPAQAVSLAQLADAIEGPTRLVRCAPPVGEPGAYAQCCELLQTCPVRSPVLKVHERLEKLFHEITVAQVAFDEEFASSSLPAPLRVLAK